MGLFLLSAAEGHQSPMNPAVTAPGGINYNTASLTSSAMQQPNGNTPQDTGPVATTENPTTLEVRL
jgi:hypothetical protein